MQPDRLVLGQAARLSGALLPCPVEPGKPHLELVLVQLVQRQARRCQLLRVADGGRRRRSSMVLNRFVGRWRALSGLETGRLPAWALWEAVLLCHRTLPFGTLDPWAGVWPPAACCRGDVRGVMRFPMLEIGRGTCSILHDLCGRPHVAVSAWKKHFSSALSQH